MNAVMKDLLFSASAIIGHCIIGGIHFLKRTGASLKIEQSFPKLHGRQGVTQLCADEGVVWSSGRDGQIRCYSVSEAGVRLVQTVRAHRDWVAGVRRVSVRKSGAGGEVVHIKDRRTLVTKVWSAQRRVLVSGGHTQQVSTVRCREGLKLTGSEDTFIPVYWADTRDLVLVSGWGRQGGARHP